MDVISMTHIVLVTLEEQFTMMSTVLLGMMLVGSLR